MGYFDFDWDYQYPNGYPEKDDTIVENEQSKVLMADYVDKERKKIESNMLTIYQQQSKPKNLTDDEWRAVLRRWKEERQRTEEIQYNADSFHLRMVR